MPVISLIHTLPMIQASLHAQLSGMYRQGVMKIGHLPQLKKRNLCNSTQEDGMV